MKGPSSPQTVEVLGIRFHNLSRAEAARAIEELARSAGGAYVVKPYSEYMPPAARDADLREVLDRADLCLADGTGILWAAHYLSLSGGRPRAMAQLALSLAALVLNPKAVRHPLKENMAGVDLTEEMLAHLERAGSRVFLLGGSEKEIQGARRWLEGRFPGLNVVGARNGYFDVRGEENEEVLRMIDDAQPDVLLVAMGFPRQERWIVANQPRLRVRVAVAEGGTFSFVSGGVSRAPRWLRRVGLEWLYRLLRQPWRVRRQLALPRFVWLVVRERLRMAGGRSSRSP